MQAGPARVSGRRLDGVEMRLELAKDVAGLGMWEWDVAGGGIHCDPQAARLFGVASEEAELPLASFEALIHPDDRAALRDALQRTARSGAALLAQPRTLLPDGGSRHLMVRGQLLPATDGAVPAVLGVVLDVTELRQAVDAESRAAARLAGLADVALELAQAESIDDLQRTVVDRGVAVLGADGGAVCVRDDATGAIRLTVNEWLPPGAPLEYVDLPLEGPFPASRAARTGEAFFLPDVASGLAISADLQEVYDGTGRQAWVALPLRARGRLLGSLAISWIAPRPFPPQERELLSAFAAQCAQTLDRIQTLDAERAAALAAGRLSEALQRSLLTDPPQPDHLHVAVRYQPAGRQAQVGGDWYDAFLTPDGATCLVIGDVTGHDRDAAAQMGALRNLLRGTAYAMDVSPAQVLTGLERAMEGLGVGALATGVLARIEQTDGSAERGERTLRWSNAGHLPPMLLLADGSVQVLATTPDLLLGLLPDAERADHTAPLPAGSTLLLFTDGLVERRGEDLDVGIARLQGCLSDLSGTVGEDLDALLDGVLTALLEGEVEDDVAVVAVRMNDQDRPRPVVAGPPHVP